MTTIFDSLPPAGDPAWDFLDLREGEEREPTPAEALLLAKRNLRDAAAELASAAISLAARVQRDDATGARRHEEKIRLLTKRLHSSAAAVAKAEQAIRRDSRAEAEALVQAEADALKTMRRRQLFLWSRSHGLDLAVFARALHKVTGVDYHALGL